MILGAIALAAYSVVVGQLLMRLRWSALGTTALAIIVWLGIAVGLDVSFQEVVHSARAVGMRMIVRAKFYASSPLWPHC